MSQAWSESTYPSKIHSTTSSSSSRRFLRTVSTLTAGIQTYLFNKKEKHTLSRHRHNSTQPISRQRESDEMWTVRNETQTSTERAAAAPIAHGRAPSQVPAPTQRQDLRLYWCKALAPHSTTNPLVRSSPTIQRKEKSEKNKTRRRDRTNTTKLGAYPKRGNAAESETTSKWRSGTLSWINLQQWRHRLRTTYASGT